jgi:spore germination protein YaaH
LLQDFESIERELTPSTTFDFGAAHVAMIKQVSKSLKASQPHATVALTMGAANLTDPLSRDVNKCYPVRELSLAADQIFIMSYDMWHHHQVCAGPNSPLPALKASLTSFIDKGAASDKLIMGLPW